MSKELDLFGSDINPDFKIDQYSGGSLYGRPFERDGIVTLTKFGEFVCEISPQGELVADFPDSGLICVYDDDGELNMVSIDLEGYLSSFSEEELRNMPNLGRDISRMAEWLGETETSIVLSVDVKGGIVELTNFSADGEEFSNVKSRKFNLSKGLDGDAKIGEITLPFRVERNGDELMLGMGESLNGDSVLDVIVISTYVDFIDDVLAGGPRDIQKLAEKIMLN